MRISIENSNLYIFIRSEMYWEIYCEIITIWHFQIMLWGTMAGLITALAIFMFCFRHDGDFCCNRKDGGRRKYYCCGPLVYREGKMPIDSDEFYD